MAKTFDVNFNFGNSINDLKNINKLSNNLQTNLEDIKITSINTGFEEAKKNVDDLTAKQADFENLIAGPAGKLSQLVAQVPVLGGFLAPLFRSPLDNINKMNISFTRFNESLANVGGLKAFSGQIGKLFTNFTANANLFTTNLVATTAVAGKAIVASIGTAFTAILPSITALLAGLGPIVVAIAGVVAAVILLKKIWQLNIGGIQKLVFGLVGSIRDNLGKAIIKFQVLLQKLGPLFKVIFTPIFTILSGLVNIIGSTVSAIFTIVDPLLDVFKELFAPFAQLQGEGNGLKVLFTALGKTIEIVAKVIAVGLRIALIPITLMAKGIAKLIEVGKVLFGVFKQLPFVQTIFKGIGNAIQFVKALIDALIAPFKTITTTVEKIGKFLGFGGGETQTPANAQPTNRPVTSTSVSTQTQNISQPNITVNTSREISSQGATDFANSLSGLLQIQGRSS